MPKTLLAIWEITVLLSLGTTCIDAASHEMPMNMTPSSRPMTTSVSRACLASGALNAGTPLEMASTPVMAAPPEAKACSTSTIDAAPVAFMASRAIGSVGIT